MKSTNIQKWEKVKMQLKKDFPGTSAEDIINRINNEKELLQFLQKQMKKNEREIRHWLSAMG